MKMAMVGLGKMGANMALRLLGGGHEVVVFDLNTESVKSLEGEGAIATASLEEVVDSLPAPKVIWVMLPSGNPTHATFIQLKELLSPGDILIDGGNSFYKETAQRGEVISEGGVHLIDVGTSGGVWGLKEGYSMMVGGDEGAVATITPLLKTLAPASDKGWGHVGPTGAGHFVKMVHNGIEYGMMQAYAEGFELMKAKGEFDLDMLQIAGIWRDGSVVRSWLLELIENSLAENPTLEGVAPFVPDSGEGRWTALEGVELGVPLPVISSSLLARFKSQDSHDFADKLLSSMRGQFGGHDVKKK